MKRNDIWRNRDFKVMLLKEIDEPFDSDLFIYEIKYDGVRAVMFVSPSEFVIKSRNGKDITNVFPELKSIQKLVKEKVIFDGEIISLENGLPSFSKVSKRTHLKNKSVIDVESKSNPVVFMAFDILYMDKDITELTLVERKKILNKFKDTDVFVKSVVFKSGKKLFREIKQLKMEGIVAKKINSSYHINERTDDFIKIKNFKSGSFFIGGYSYNKNGISLALGEYIDDKFCFVGKVSLNSKYELYDKVLKLKESKNYFCNYKENINYVKPSLKCEVSYIERTLNNNLRQPVYKGSKI